MPPESTHPRRALRVAVFPSAANVHLYHAIDRGIFSEYGVAVDLHEVTSSVEQMRLWDEGEIDVMHTALDHLFRGRRRRPVAVRGEGVGELEVYLRGDVAPGSARWAVDGVDSAFSFVLRAIVAHHTGTEVPVEQLVTVGGTKQRFESLIAGDVDGTTLHPPFGALARTAGLQRLGGHLEVLPDYLGVAVIADASDVGGAVLLAYLGGLQRSAREILAGGAQTVIDVLVARGFPEAGATAVASEMLGATGPLDRGPVTRDNLLVSARLRDRYVPGGHALALDLADLLPPEQVTAGGDA